MKPALLVRPKAKLGAQCNVVWDGHSNASGVGGSNNNYAAGNIVHTMPTTGAGTFVNCAIGGQTLQDMIANPSDVDNAWVAGKTNVLIIWEVHNCLYGFREVWYGEPGPAIACLGYMKQYIAERRAIHPWIVVVCSTIPSQAFSDTARTNFNIQMTVVDQALAANPSYYGIDAIVNLRQAGSPFNLPDYTDASFAATPGVYNEAPGFMVHLSDYGKQVVANLVEERLRNLRGVPHQ